MNWRDFKLINDQFGHSAGDEVLKAIAQTLKESVRSCDILARLGGDEFVILLPQISYEQAVVALGRTHQQLQLLSQTHGWPVGYSIGVITCVVLPNSIDNLIAQADQLMYTVKSSGKNRLDCREYND
ncbi:GGDEF domain-containing protein [Nodosilinea sp. LEGE 07088]|uniref:GGDEF domain-containing protein n=1 Tax=Nodosilinea sp. LEGE 07088 TaxID=2777968 RepID=UPI0018812BB5|nr:GGDEF domain-containing protein [Nodosilinea sp. LEGE 07088]MBE9141537.1 GGDEF domain-containing protein [Nodosilinea sp. LEGE 07088]